MVFLLRNKIVSCLFVLFMSFLAIVGFKPTIVQASVTEEYRGQTTGVVEFWNYNYEWGLYGRAQEDDLSFTLYLNDFAHRSPNMSVDFMVFGDGSPMALRGNSFHAYFEVYFDSQEGGVYFNDEPEVLVYFMYDLNGAFEVSVAECDFIATDGSGDCYVTIDCSTVPDDVYGFMVRLYDTVNTCWFQDWERSSSDVCVSQPYVGEITSTIREVVGGADDFYDEQLVWSENIFENLKIIGEYIWNLPSRIVNGIGSFFNDLVESIGGFFDDLVESIGGFFDGLARDIAIAVASLFNFDDYQEGNSSISPEIDDALNNGVVLPDIGEFVPDSNSPLLGVFKVFFDVDVIYYMLLVVVVVGVTAFFIFK